MWVATLFASNKWIGEKMWTATLLARYKCAGEKKIKKLKKSIDKFKSIVYHKNTLRYIYLKTEEFPKYLGTLFLYKPPLFNTSPNNNSIIINIITSYKSKKHPIFIIIINRRKITIIHFINLFNKIMKRILQIII